ncbi:MAG: hypothetical protein Q8Q62_20065, partial [Mesorhizobium sp.]|nr:hypothetical protein [Mesorhizobium sp.]
MTRYLMAAALGLALAAQTTIVRAQDSEPETIPFEGGAFAITETPEMDKTLSFDGQLLARNYYVSLDRIILLGDTNVALFWVGEGGNACGPAMLIAWRNGGSMDSDIVGEDDCGAPPASATSDTLYF